MKRMLSILVVLVFTGTVQAVDLGLVNPGFEEIPDFDGWIVWSWISGVARIEPNNPHSGNYCAAFDGTGTGGAGAYQYFDVNDPNIGAGALVTFSGYIRTEGPSPGACLVIAWMPAPPGLEKGRVQYCLGSSLPNWTFGKVSGFVPDYIDDVKISYVKFEINNLQGEGTGLFDDMVAESTEYLPEDSENLLINESFESTEDGGGGHLVPILWSTKTDLDACDVNDEVVTDGTALDRDIYWSLTESNEPNLALYQSGYQAIIGNIIDTNVYHVVVNLRNPGVMPVDVQVGFDFYGPPYESYWGSDYSEFVVPADNQWHEYEHAVSKWVGSTMMQARVGVRNGTIHVDKTAVYDISDEPCKIAKLSDPDFTLLPGDINEDCQVDFTDLRLIVENWMGTGCNSSNDWCSGADIDNDGDVNLIDFADYALYYLESNY